MNKNQKIGWSIATLLLIAAGGLFLFSGNNSSPTGNVVLDNSVLVGDSERVTIYFFWGDGCPHCANQKPYLEEWDDKYPEVEVKMFETWKNPNNVKLFQEAASVYEIQARGVPTTFIGEKNWIGFSESMALEMESYIQECISEGCESPLN